AALGPARPEPGRRGPAGTRTRTRAGRGARPPRPTHATAMTRENTMNASIESLALQQAAAHAPPLAGIDTTLAPIAASGLDKRYEGRLALDRVSLQLEPGAVLGLIGRN